MGYEQSLVHHYDQLNTKFRKMKSPEEIEIERLKKLIESLQFELNLARQELKILPEGLYITPTINHIIDLVCIRESSTKVEIISHTRRQLACYARQIAIYLCTKCTICTSPQIARQFGGRDHTTVLNARDKIAKKRLSDSNFDKYIQTYEQEISTWDASQMRSLRKPDSMEKPLIKDAMADALAASLTPSTASSPETICGTHCVT